MMKISAGTVLVCGVFLTGCQTLDSGSRRSNAARETTTTDYLKADVARPLYETYDRILGKIVVMIQHPEKWIIGGKGTR